MRVRTRTEASQRIAEIMVWKVGLTFAHVPAQVTETVPGVEREGRGEDDLARVLDAFGKASDELDDISRAEGLGRDEVCERVAIEHWRAGPGRCERGYPETKAKRD